MCALRRDVIRSGFSAVSVRLLGVVVGLLLAESAVAFSPRPGAMLAGANVPANVVVLLDNSTSMRRTVTGELTADDERRRISIARKATRSVLAQNRGANYGLFVYNPATANNRAPGGRMLLPVASVAPGTGDAHFNALLQQIEQINPPPSPITYTPLGETYYEITRYMRGLTPHYTGSGVSRFTSPIEYRCQRNFALVVTDGLPTHDFDQASDMPPEAVGERDPDGNNPDTAGDFNLPNWRGAKAPFYLAELASFANETDLRNPSRHGITLDAAGRSWADPAFPRQTMQTYVIGFALAAEQAQGDAAANPLAAAASAGGGRYFAADSAAELCTAMREVLREINATAGSGGSSAASSASLVPGYTLFYRTRYDPDGWVGAVEALTLDAQGRIASQEWTTDATYTPTQRGLFQTYSQSANQVVNITGATPAANLSATQREQLRAEGHRAGLSVDAANDAADSMLNWVRGNTPVPAALRSRNRLMGDIINSPLRHSTTDTQSANDASEAYQAYRELRLNQMTPSLVVGANDGLLHVLSADNGAHRLAYLPVSAFSSLGSKARADYGGGYYVPGVDGPVQLADVHLSTGWSTVALAGMGPGGRSLIALRLFDQSRHNDALGALWERGPDNTGWENLGYTYATPVFGRLADGTAVMLIGNGYGSANGLASLIVASVDSGQVIREFVVDGRVGGHDHNGLSSPQLVVDSQGVVQRAYAGDLHGQLWAFDLSADNPVDWSVAFAGQPLFRAAANQPITVPPQVIDHPEAGYLVLFGTGKLLEQLDLVTTDLQAFYAVWDKPGSAGQLSADRLRSQHILSQPTVNGQRHRILTQHPVDWRTHKGWYLPLSHAGEQRGERVIRPFLLRNSRVIFTTALVDNSSNDDPCEGLAGDGWLMALDLYSGGMLAYPVLDTNQDAVVDGADRLTAGIGLDVGLPGDITVVRGEQAEHYLIDGSAGTDTISGLVWSVFRRIMWRQLM